MFPMCVALFLEDHKFHVGLCRCSRSTYTISFWVGFFHGSSPVPPLVFNNLTNSRFSVKTFAQDLRE